MTFVLDLIGETPLIEVTRFDRGPCRLFLKLESANPSGSIKDRPARAMIEAAEVDGRLQPGGTIVEATAGNTGLGLALVGGRKGYRIVLVVPDKMAREKILHCKAMGAEVVLTRSDVGRGHPDYYQDLAEDITARTPGALFINQFANPAKRIPDYSALLIPRWDLWQSREPLRSRSEGNVYPVAKWMNRARPFKPLWQSSIGDRAMKLSDTGSAS